MLQLSTLKSAIHGTSHAMHFYHFLLPKHHLFTMHIAHVSASDVLDSLKAVTIGKAAGIDGFSAEHFVCAHTKISVHLSLLFTTTFMLTYGHMLSALIRTAIVPILENRQGDTSDKNNNRVIAIVTAISKRLELYI